MEAPNVGGQGDHVYRTRQPCRALGELPGVTVASGSWLSPALHRLLPGADVLVVCDVVDADLLPVFARRRQQGRLTVYEVNDHFRALQSWNKTAYLAENLLTRSLSAQLAAHADANQFTVPELVRSFGALNARQAVFPNQLWEVPPPRQLGNNAQAPVWLGWGGSLGHRQDLAWVMPALQSTLSRHPRVKLAIMGPEELRSLFSWVPADRFRFTPGGKVERYYEFLGELDIGLCPLLPTDFNRCRSDVKFLELAAHGVAAVCSRLPPYADTVKPSETGLLFSSLEELSAGLDQLIARPAVRAELTRAAHDYVAAERDERAHAHQRLEVYQRWQQETAMATGTQSPAPLSADELSAWEELERMPASFPRSSYRLLSGTELEGLLYTGLTRARDGRGDEALRLYRQAAGQAPGYHVPALLAGAADPDSRQGIAMLERAAELAPGSPSVSLLLATRREQSGDLEGATLELQRCRKLSPHFGAAEARLAGLAERGGQREEAMALHHAALEANPYFAEPALRLGLMNIEAGDASSALEVLGRAVEHDDGLWSLRFVRGRALLAAGQAQQARAELERALEVAPDPTPVLAQLAQAYVKLGNLEAAGMIVAELRRLAEHTTSAPGGAAMSTTP